MFSVDLVLCGSCANVSMRLVRANPGAERCPSVLVLMSCLLLACLLGIA